METNNYKIEIINKIENPEDDNVDVFIYFDNGEEYYASFFTLQNIINLIKKNEHTGECINGMYFWSSDMIIVKELKLEDIEKVVNDLLREGSFYVAFQPSNRKAKARKDKEAPLTLNDEI